MPVKKCCLSGTLSWRAFVLMHCNREVKADVKSTLYIISRSNTSYWHKLMRVQNGVLCAWEWIYKLSPWCLTTSEWLLCVNCENPASEWFASVTLVNNHCYFVSFEHSVSLHAGITFTYNVVTDLASSSWGGGIRSSWIKHCLNP